MTELKDLIVKRGQIKGQITRFTTFIDEFDIATKSIFELQTRLTKIEALWQQFEDIQSEIVLLSTDTAHDDYRREFEDLYFSGVARATELVAAHRSTQSGSTITSPTHSAPTSGVAMQSIKLPVIPVPNFYGDYREWPGFFNTFTALVDKNTSLSCAQKFYYLKEAVRGEAKQVIESLEVSEQNYIVALDLLKSRFDNKRLIKRSHIASLFNIPALMKESYQSLRRFLDEINKHVRALKNLGESVDTWDSILLYLISTKLDATTKRDWEKYSTKLENEPKLTDLETFLSERCNILETLDSSVNRTQNKITPKRADTRSFASSNLYHNSGCSFCKGSHYIYTCYNLLKLSVPSRLQELKKLKLCTNCLRPGHQTNECRSSGCKKCNGRHNSLIHMDNENIATSGGERAQSANISAKENESSNHSETSSLATNNSANKYSQVLLSTALINISNNSGKMVSCRALLDSGSQSNFISRNMYTKLGLTGRKINLPVTGIGQVQTKINSIIDSTISSMRNNYRKVSSFLIIDKITDEMPSSDFDISNLNIPHEITLADPSFNSSGSIDILLGAEIFWDIILNGQINLGSQKPILQNTKLGWIVAGAINSNSTSLVTRAHCNFVHENTLHEQIEKFWAIEECQFERSFSREEAMCEEIFVNTTTRDSTGRLVVNLPLRKPVSLLGDSENNALKRYLLLEKKLNCNSKLKKEYTEFINEYRELGHMTKVNDEISNETVKYYLPHHCVLKESSTTTKLRVVFDASAKTTSNVSLNDILMIGPIIQDDLFSILLRFRKYNFVIIADIEKMYRQILINEDQRDLQRILWRDNLDEPISHYRLNTVTYGTSSASFLAIRSLHQLARENSERYPEASKIILSDFYVDDLITGTNTLPEMLKIKREICEILEGGKFHLRKWMSNSREELIASEQNSEGTSQYIISDGSCIKTLGLIWNANSDTIQVTTFTEPVSENITKRLILSTISQVFDPLGLVGPIIIKAKILLQQLWLLKIGWDDPVPTETYATWQQFCSQIHKLKELKIPRLVLAHNYDTQHVQLHGFSDASEVAYGACVYARSCDSHGHVTVSLICAKSKVAPVKSLTLPRLELSGALLLAQLMRSVIEALKLNISDIVYWCDSTITLSWISAPSNNWKTFVCNRVSKIQQLTSNHQWRYVRSEDNPADIISRGTTPEKLITLVLWWSGPIWLSQNPDSWPNNIVKSNEAIPEGKIVSLLQTEIVLHEIFLRYSSLTKLQRIVAYLYRFLNNCKKNRVSGNLSVDELHHSMNVLLRVAQSESFPEELNRLKNGKQTHRSSKLSSLNPFIDENGIIRVGGRLSKAKVTIDQKHPIIISNKHPITRLIILHEHLKNFHAGPQATLAFVRHTFWPLRGKSTIKQILHNCVKCFKARPTSTFPQMANLPLERVQAVRPFFNTGVDFAGPFYIKDGITRNRKIVKCYLCIFICLATRAVHLELCGNMSTECFLNALKRFVSRRGICNTIFSDNGTNFRGANNELVEISNLLSQNLKETKIEHYLTQNSIKWKFIPANSPHFGGSWEAAVKLAKYHMKRIVGNAHLTFEDLNTIFVQIEAILNSRPLTPISDSPNDLTALTPSHFLIGDILNNIPQQDMTQVQPGRLSHYHRLQQIVQHFWNRWKSEYLSQLQARTKWKFISPAKIEVGAMVVLKIDNVPPLSWPMGRIVQLHPSDDGNIRVVSVKTSNGIIKRAVTKICILPTGEEDI